MISLSRVRQVANLDAKDDSKLLALKSQVVEQFVQLTGKVWSTYTNRLDYYDLSHEHCRLVPLKVANATVSLVEYLSLPDWITFTDDYIVVRDALRSSVDLPMTLRVTASGGYADDAAPAQILEAIALQVRFLLERNQTGRVALKSKNFEGGDGVFMEIHPMYRDAIAQNRWRMP